MAVNIVPSEEEGFVDVVEDVNDEVVIGGGVDVGARELIIDQDAPLGNA